MIMKVQPTISKFSSTVDISESRLVSDIQITSNLWVDTKALKSDNLM